MGPHSDVWSLGCILHELLALRPAFAAQSIRQVKAKVLLGAAGPLPPACSPELRGLVAAMLEADPEKRITMPQLLELPAVAPRLAELRQQGVVGTAHATLRPSEVRRRGDTGARACLPACAPRLTHHSHAHTLLPLSGSGGAACSHQPGATALRGSSGGALHAPLRG